MSVYRAILRPLLFRVDPERAHQAAVALCESAGRFAPVQRATSLLFAFEDARLRQTIAGIDFANPIGLAAGLDKNGRAIDFMAALGFGHIEIGSISAHVSHGNPRPRLFRIPLDRGIIVNYGVPNEGADAVAERLRGRRCAVPLGINLVKTNDASRPAFNDEVFEDYAQAFARLQGFADYVSLNLSCPNSPNDRDFFDDLRNLKFLLERLEHLEPRVPIFLKIKPTTDKHVLAEIVSISDSFPFIAGFGINLPAGKPSALELRTPADVLQRCPGAVSGKPVENFINAVLAQLRSVIGLDSRYALMAAGGVFTAEDAYRKIRLGASLVQLYTGLIYQGPGLVKEILAGLVRLLDRDGFDSLTQAISLDCSPRFGER